MGNNLIFRCPYTADIYKNRTAAEEKIKTSFPPKLLIGYHLNGKNFDDLKKCQNYINKFGFDNYDNLEKMKDEGHGSSEDSDNGFSGVDSTKELENKSLNGKFPLFPCPLCLYQAIKNQTSNSSNSPDINVEQLIKNLPHFDDKQKFYQHVITCHSGVKDLSKFMNEASRLVGLILPDEFVSSFQKIECQFENREISKNLENQDDDVEKVNQTKTATAATTAQPLSKTVKSSKNNNNNNNNHNEKTANKRTEERNSVNLR